MSIIYFGDNLPIVSSIGASYIFISLSILHNHKMEKILKNINRRIKTMGGEKFISQISNWMESTVHAGGALGKMPYPPVHGTIYTRQRALGCTTQDRGSKVLRVGHQRAWPNYGAKSTREERWWWAMEIRISWRWPGGTERMYGEIRRGYVWRYRREIGWLKCPSSQM